MPFELQQLEIPEVLLITRHSFHDSRGFFAELYAKSEFFAAGLREDFVQDNFSHSTQNVLRGLHYQIRPKAQGKLVMALSGSIFDVAVDIRSESSTYGKWVGTTLSSDNGQALYIPPGFAHGFCVLSEKANVFYKVTEEYAPELDRGIIWNDADINIHWPVTPPVLSAKDAALPSLKEAQSNFHVF